MSGCGRQEPVAAGGPAHASHRQADIRASGWRWYD